MNNKNSCRLYVAFLHYKKHLDALECSLNDYKPIKLQFILKCRTQVRDEINRLEQTAARIQSANDEKRRIQSDLSRWHAH